MPANVVIRPGTVDDLEAVKAIYDGYVATSVATFDTVPSSLSSWEEKVSCLYVDADGVHTAVAVIALPNPGSLALHESLGFVQAGALREVGHKFGHWVDTAFYH